MISLLLNKHTLMTDEHELLHLCCAPRLNIRRAIASHSVALSLARPAGYTYDTSREKERKTLASFLSVNHIGICLAACMMHLKHNSALITNTTELRGTVVALW